MKRRDCHQKSAVPQCRSEPKLLSIFTSRPSGWAQTGSGAICFQNFPASIIPLHPLQLVTWFSALLWHLIKVKSENFNAASLYLFWLLTYKGETHFIFPKSGDKEENEPGHSKLINRELEVEMNE